MAQVVLKNISKIFTNSKGRAIHALRDASLTVEQGEFMVIVGPSGSGKSTLLRLIAGLEDTTSGTISIGGNIANNVPPQDRDIAMVFQNYALYPHMTVYENIAFGLKLRKVPKTEIDRLVRETGDSLGLTAHLDSLPMVLSGGQKQRVALGRAIVRKPSVFLFDEPLSNLDARMRAQMRMEISKLHKSLGVTMIFVTHDQVEAMSLGDRIAVICDGVIQQVAGPIQLYNDPVNLFVAGFIGSPPMNLFSGLLLKRENEVLFQMRSETGKVSENAISFRLDQTATQALNGGGSREVILGLRPEDIGVSETIPVHNQEGPNCVSITEAIVEHVEPLGPETYLYSKAGTAQFTARVRADFSVAANQRIRLGFNMRRAHIFDPATQNRIGP